MLNTKYRVRSLHPKDVHRLLGLYENKKSKKGAEAMPLPRSPTLNISLFSLAEVEAPRFCEIACSRKRMKRGAESPQLYRVFNSNYLFRHPWGYL